MNLAQPATPAFLGLPDHDGSELMPWGAGWDEEFLGEVRALVALRRESETLARGGIRYVHVSDDSIAYLRETRDERLLCRASRVPEAIDLPFTSLEPLYESSLFNVWRIHG